MIYLNSHAEGRVKRKGKSVGKRLLKVLSLPLSVLAIALMCHVSVGAAGVGGEVRALREPASTLASSGVPVEKKADRQVVEADPSLASSNLPSSPEEGADRLVLEQSAEGEASLVSPSSKQAEATVVERELTEETNTTVSPAAPVTHESSTEPANSVGRVNVEAAKALALPQSPAAAQSVRQSTLPSVKPTGRLVYFVSDRPSITEYANESFYLKACASADTTPGYRYMFYLEEEGRRTLIEKNDHGNLIYRPSRAGQQKIAVDLMHGDSCLASRSLSVTVRKNRDYSYLTDVSVYIDQTTLTDQNPSLYLKTSNQGGVRPLTYRYYLTNEAGQKLRLISSNDHGNLIYSPTQAGSYRFLVEIEATTGDRAEALSRVFSYRPSPPKINYFVSDLPGGLLAKPTSAYFKGEATGSARGGRLTYEFDLLQGGLVIPMLKANHGDYATTFKNILPGSYQMRLTVSDERGAQARRSIPVRVTGRPIHLEYAVASPSSLKDSSREGFYIKAAATSVAGGIQYDYFKKEGDLYVSSGETFMRNHSSAALRSDIVSVAHHGIKSVDSSIYHQIKASVVFVPEMAKTRSSSYWRNGHLPALSPYAQTFIYGMDGTQSYTVRAAG